MAANFYGSPIRDSSSHDHDYDLEELEEDSEEAAPERREVGCLHFKRRSPLWKIVLCGLANERIDRPRVGCFFQVPILACTNKLSTAQKITNCD